MSIIIVNWNTKHLLQKCLCSIQRNTSGISYEIIVSDNASKDGSQEMVSKEFPEVKLIKNDSNLGFAKANNIGIREAKGVYILLLNSDTEVQGDVLRRSIEFFNTDDEKTGILGCKLRNPDGTLQPSCFNFVTISRIFTVKVSRALDIESFMPNRLLLAYNNWQHDHERKVDYVKGAFMMIRSKLIDEVGLLDEDYFMYGEEADFCYRANISGWVTKFVPLESVIHYGGGSAKNKPSIKTKKERFISRYHFFNKNYGKIYANIHKWISLSLNYISKFTIKKYSKDEIDYLIKSISNAS